MENPIVRPEVPVGPFDRGEGLYEEWGMRIWFRLAPLFVVIAVSWARTFKILIICRAIYGLAVANLGDWMDGCLQEVLLEFRAGKMLLDGTRVRADPRKGLVRITRVRFIPCFAFCNEPTRQ